MAASCENLQQRFWWKGGSRNFFWLASIKIKKNQLCIICFKCSIFNAEFFAYFTLMLQQVCKWNESGRAFFKDFLLFTWYKCIIFKLLSLSVLSFCLDFHYITKDVIVTSSITSQSYVWHFLFWFWEDWLSKLFSVFYQRFSLLASYYLGKHSYWICFSVERLSFEFFYFFPAKIFLLSGKL